MSKELFHQSMKNSRDLEARDNTWEGQETSETWLQKCLNTRQVFRSFFLPGVPVCHKTPVQMKQEYLQFIELR